MKEILDQLGIQEKSFGGFCGDWLGSGEPLAVETPIDGSRIGVVTQVTTEEYEKVVQGSSGVRLRSWTAILRCGPVGDA
jgi:hypothetical protein